MTGRVRRLGLYAASAAVSLGIAVIVAGEIAGWGWARLLASVLVSAGGIAVGVLFGLTEPGRRRLGQVLEHRAALVIVLALLVVVVPVALALGVTVASATVAVARDPGGTPVAGLLLSLAMLLATLAVTVVSVRAVRDATGTGSHHGVSSSEEAPQ